MIDKLQFLIALSQTKHFGQAAESTNVSQPTLAGAIKQLEEQLGPSQWQEEYKEFSEQSRRIIPLEAAE